MTTEKELPNVDSLIEKLDKKPIGAAPDEESAPARPSAEYYNRLLMERYGLIPKGSAQAANSPTTANPSELFRQRYGISAAKKDKGRVESKLEEIALNEVTFDSLPLPQVLQFLAEESRKRDSEKRGINFLINPNATQATATTAIDPNTGQPIQAPPSEPQSRTVAPIPAAAARAQASAAVATSCSPRPVLSKRQAVLRDDLSTEGEAQSSSVRPRCKKRLEQVFLALGRNAWSCVTEADRNCPRRGTCGAL